MTAPDARELAESAIRHWTEVGMGEFEGVRELALARALLEALDEVERLRGDLDNRVADLNKEAEERCSLSARLSAWRELAREAYTRWSPHPGTEIRHMAWVACLNELESREAGEAKDGA